MITVNSIGEVHQLFELPKPKHPLISIIYHSDELEEKFQQLSSVKCVLNLYSVMFKEGCTGSLNYGRGSYDFEEGSMVFLAPGQVIQPNEMEQDQSEDNKGWTLIFHPDLIRRSNLGQNIDDYSFFNYDVNEALHLSDQEKISVSEIIHKIEAELNGNIDKHSQKLIVSNIELLLDYSTRYYDRQFYTRTNQSNDLVAKFEKYLKVYFNSGLASEKGLPSVRSCGEELGLSPNYLSDLLKKETGVNAHDHIHHAIINRAKTELLKGQNSVSSIAYDLGFEYPQHFSKLFKNKTGMSPKDYRLLN